MSDRRIGGVPVDVEAAFVDRYEGRHRLLAAGPHLKCVEHGGRIEKEGVAEALAAVSHARRCERYVIAWQRVMLADDVNYAPVLRVLPKSLLAYHADQTRRHAARLDAALAPATERRDRRRWHSVGWRASPTLAAQYQAVGVEAGVAFVAMKNLIPPDDVQRAADDPRSPLGIALRDGGSDRLKLLNLGVRTRPTDDFAYDPLDASLPAIPPKPRAQPPEPEPEPLPDLANLDAEEVAEKIRAWVEGHELTVEERPPPSAPVRDVDAKGLDERA
jgi:hypothetical protein